MKVSALCSHYKPDDFDYTYRIVSPRLKKILLTAKKENVFIQVDAEHYPIRNLVFEVYKKVLLETVELHDYFATGIVLQCYLKDAYAHFLDILDLAKKRKLIMPIRLVKGAYFDAETIETSAGSHPSYQFLNKEETDIHYRQIIFETLKNYSHLQLCLGSHNLMDHAYAAALRETYFPSALPIEHQCLHMTYEALSLALANLKWTVRNYAPVGDLLTGMGYLVRRILENSSQVGILAQMRIDKSKKINQPMELPHQKAKKRFNNNDWNLDSVIKNMNGTFVNIASVRSHLKEELPLIKEQIAFKHDLKKIHFLNQTESLKAIEQSTYAFKDGEWSKLKPIERSSILLRAQNIMVVERGFLASLINQEAKKTILESYADVDEAIDFLNFYARENLVNCNEGSARGPIAVISPWNFPLAIPCGMVAASLVTGNTVILKSAEQTPLITEKLVDLFYRAGVPQNVLIHAPGLGEIVGETLVSSQDISGVIFTGSKKVGTYIFNKLSQDFYDHPHLKIKIPKRVVTEMGGKNCLIVTKSAELDETIVGILKSAFNHSGQKCSALSRVLVDKRIKDKLIKRLKLAILDLEVGVSDQFSTVINPLISIEDVQRIKNVISEIRVEIKNSGGEIIVDRSQESFPDNCVGPALVYLPFSYVGRLERTSNSSIQNEHFGPILHITEFSTLDEAISLFNNSEYALTGGIYSQSQDEIDYVVSSLNAGNIYINRNITGARVGIEPFGGFKFSGTGPKAGGTDYLMAFRYCGKNPYFAMVDKNKIEKFDNEMILDETLISYTDNGEFFSDKSVDQFNFTIGEISQNLDKLFPFWDAQHKKEIFKIKIWTFENLKKYINRKIYTEKIAGQTNFNDYRKIKEKGLIISTSMEISFFVFLYFIVSVSLGCKIKIICTNKNSYSFWQTLADIFYQNGYSVNQIKVLEGGLDLVNIVCENSILDFLIFDSSIDFIKDVKLTSNQALPMILSAYESASFDKLESFYELFFYKRTFAINLMRYGAPLIEGDQI
ncbi:MAG: bifunctional proline dehydrogenase/L-glutamate gamma-semialdehyde dehydrogenase [Bacteriovoracaceae bacterium]